MAEMAAMITRRLVLTLPLLFLSRPALAAPWQQDLVLAAEAQIGRTVAYDPAYVRIAYPGGDVSVDRGVCTDVIIRAYREGLNFDLQKAVHEDMAAHFSAYPKLWGMKRPDSNIDHRRVPNLQTYFTRRGASLGVTDRAGDYHAGDLVSMMLPGNLAHIAIVSATATDDGARGMLIHNIGGGTQLEDVLFRFALTGHYRFNPGKS
jgi:uncharacterized protein YijF (DUF1287 family)